MKREFDEKAALEAMKKCRPTPNNASTTYHAHGFTEGFIEGQRQMHSQDSELIERLEAENGRMQRALLNDGRFDEDIEKESLESQNTELKKRVEELEALVGVLTAKVNKRTQEKYDEQSKLTIAIKALNESHACLVHIHEYENTQYTEGTMTIIGKALTKLSERSRSEEVETEKYGEFG